MERLEAAGHTARAGSPGTHARARAGQTHRPESYGHGGLQETRAPGARVLPDAEE